MVNYPDNAMNDGDAILLLAAVYVRDDQDVVAVPGVSSSVSYRNAVGDETTVTSPPGDVIDVYVPGLKANLSVEPV